MPVEGVNHTAVDRAEDREVDPLNAAVGARIRHIREEAGLRAVEAARAAGITKGYLWRMEEGRQNLSIRSLSRIALALGTTMSHILDGVAADPSTLGVRDYAWKDGADRRRRKTGAAEAEPRE